MRSRLFRYRFSKTVPMVEVESSLLLAILSVEGLHGETDVHLNATHHLDADRRTCLIDATTSVGRDLNKVFATFLRREFGNDAFRVQRVSSKKGSKQNVKTDQRPEHARSHGVHDQPRT